MRMRKDEGYMNNSERLAVLETTIININSNLVDIKQAIVHQSDKTDQLSADVNLQIRHLSDKMDQSFADANQQIRHLADKTDQSFIDVRQEIRHVSDKLETRLDSIQNRLWSNFLWLISGMIGLAGLIAHTQHWV